MKNNTTTQLIAKEGWKYVSLTFFIFLLSLCFDTLEWVFFVIFIFTVYIFRNPERIPAEDDSMAVLSPLDGTITNISKFLYTDGKEYIKVDIQKSLLEVSLLRAPTNMSIKSTARRYGLFLPTHLELGKKLGESAKLSCSSIYDELFLHVHAGMFARKIDLFKTIGPLKSAQRFGLLVEGSIELFLALDTRIKVSVGDEVKAGESVLGYFAHKEKLDDK